MRGLAIDEGAVRRAHVGDGPPGCQPLEHGVAARHTQIVGQDDVVRLVAPDREPIAVQGDTPGGLRSLHLQVRVHHLSLSFAVLSVPLVRRSARPAWDRERSDEFRPGSSSGQA